MLVLRQRLLAGLVAFTGIANSRKFGPSFSMSTQHAPSGEQGPVNCERYLTYDYKPVGNEMKLKDSTQFYGVGSPRTKQGIILIPDTWGWNAGRIRNIADFLATNDIYCAIPQLMGSSTEANSGPSLSEASSFGDYMKSATFDSHLKPKICSLAKYMFSEGVEKIALVGFSWGGWVAINVLASDIADNFVCGVLPHPSLNLEERMYGGSLTDLFSRVERPILVLPARGDPDEYAAFTRLLKYKCPTTDYIDYHGIEHGFLLRGNIDDNDIKQANIRSLGQILHFCQQHFKMDPSQLVTEGGKKGFSDTGEFSGSRRASSWGSWFGGGPNVRDSAQHAGHVVGDTARQGYDKTKQAGQYVGEQAKQAGQYVRESTEEGYERARQTASSTGEYINNRTQQGYEQARDMANRTGQYVGDTTRYGYQQAEQTGEAAKERTKEAGSSLGDYTKKAGDVIWEGAHRLGESIKQTFVGEGGEQDQGQAQQETGSSSRSTGDYLSDKGQQGYEQAQHTGQWMGEKANQTGQAAQDRAKQGYSKAQETGQWIGDQANQAGDYLRDQAGKLKEGTEHTAHKGYDQAANVGEYVQDQVNSASQSAKNTAHKGAEQAQQTGEKVRDKGKEAVKNAEHRDKSPEDRGAKKTNK